MAIPGPSEAERQAEAQDWLGLASFALVTLTVAGVTTFVLAGLLTRWLQ